MKANTPWSGNYELQPALWAIAHTTQFAQPGWKYLDRRLRAAARTAAATSRLRSPEADGDYSIIIETIDAKTPQTFSFRVDRRAGDRAAARLAQQPAKPVRPAGRHSRLAGNAFSVVLEPGCIYSLTTTTGQQKGQDRDSAAGRVPAAVPGRFRERSSRASCPSTSPIRAARSKWPSGPTAAGACGRRSPGRASTGNATPIPIRIR